MSQTYSDQDREEALDLLTINRNNIALTSIQTHIPERTLREWRRKQRLKAPTLPPYPPPAAAADRFDSIPEALNHVHSRILEQLVELADSLPEILATAPPYHQLLALTQLIDRVEKLQALVPRLVPQQTIQVQFKDPDYGTLHDTPFWSRNESED